MAGGGVAGGLRNLGRAAGGGRGAVGGVARGVWVRDDGLAHTLRLLTFLIATARSNISCFVACNTVRMEG